MSATIEEVPPPGGLAAVIRLHGEWYAREWGLGPGFEAQVAAGLGDFALALPREDSRLFLAVEAGRVLGGIAVDGRAEPGVARIRWFIVEEAARGGLGQRLLRAALEFCGRAGMREVWLTSFAGLDAARRLYERHGFVLEAEEVASSYGKALLDQRFRLRIGEG